MTFEDKPQKYSSVNSPLVYVVYDANAVNPALEDYKYVAELYVNSVLVFTARSYPNPISGKGIFDFASVTREYIIPTLKSQLGVSEWQVSARVDIYEEYNGIIHEIAATGEDIIVYNHYNGRINDFTKLGDYVDLPLSNRPRIIYMKSNTTNFYIPYFSDSGTTYDVVINLDASTYTTPVNAIENINIADNLTSDYLVTINGVEYQVKVLCEGLYTNYYLHFLNKWGGFETMLFNKASKRSFDYEKKSYQQQAYRVDNDGIVSVKSGEIMHEQKTTYASTFKEKLRVSTDWIEDDEYVWLAQLVASPMVYLEDLDGTFYPVQIINSTYEEKQHITDKLTNLVLDLEFNTTYKTQFR